ncbi:MAG: ATP-binding protein [Candidatus Pacebacteria bacterium]|nr:ATP-binding protein [Candidatus Paceibacterota bacterium]
MRKFYNRKNELAMLDKHFRIAKNNIFTEVIIGRRRIGKTELIKEHLEKKPALYFYVTKKSSQITLNDFTATLKERFPFVPSIINNWEDFFNLIFELSGKQRMVVVFDEFQNFNSIDKSVFSILQKKIDEYKDKSKMQLIFIGSIQTLMEKIFMRKEPLYGRVDNFIYLKPFSFGEVAVICNDHKVKNIESVFNLFSIFDGVAKYYDFLEKFNLFNKPLEIILKELFISRDTPLYKEGKNLLIEEFGQDYERYFDILFCLSIGKTKTSEIASVMQLPVTTVSKYLSVLVKKYKLAEKRNLHNKKNSKDNRYYLRDIFLRFWFRYVYKNYTKIEIGSYQPILSDFKKTFDSHQGLIFEELARKLLYKKMLEEKILPCQAMEISNYWDKKYEFDIYGQENKNFIIGEIKLNSKAVDKKLIYKIEEFADFRNKNAIKVIITFDKITNLKMKKLLKEKNFYIFDLMQLNS